MADIKITISGPSNSGRSTIAHLITGLLKGFGFNVSVEIDLDYASLEDKNRIIAENLSDKIKDLRSKHNINIIEEYEDSPDEDPSLIDFDFGMPF